MKVAEALLADVKGKSHLDPGDESNAVTVTLLGLWLSQPEQGKNRLLEDYIQRSVDSRAYFDAVFFIFDFLVDQFADIPRPLKAWIDEFSDGAGVDLRWRHLTPIARSTLPTWSATYRYSS